jgi:hypothetical protein
MYGGSKNDGSTIGDTTGDMSVGLDISEAEDTTAAEESLMCMNEEGEVLTLSAQLHPDSGRVVWRQRYDSEAILQRTVGMSQMTSMLRDNDRNSVYDKATAILINHFKEVHGRAPTVLDIGTGTGLLAMLCVRNGAGFVFGVEMFDAMAAIATGVVSDQDLDDQIIIINAKSSDVDSLHAARSAGLGAAGLSLAG